MSKKLQKYWYQQGVKAGKTDGWMNLEETLAEDLEGHPGSCEDAVNLVQTGIEGWEETDHFQMLYGGKIAGDARDEVKADYLNDDAIEKWQDYKESFWEGYIVGRQKIGIDIYKLANDLISKKTKKAAGKKAGVHKHQGKYKTASSALQGLRR